MLVRRKQICQQNFDETAAGYNIWLLYLPYILNVCVTVWPHNVTMQGNNRTWRHSAASWLVSARGGASLRRALALLWLVVFIERPSREIETLLLKLETAACSVLQSKHSTYHLHIMWTKHCFVDIENKSEKANQCMNHVTFNPWHDLGSLGLPMVRRVHKNLPPYFRLQLSCLLLIDFKNNSCTVGSRKEYSTKR